jgi:hypothetical protein
LLSSVMKGPADRINDRPHVAFPCVGLGATIAVDAVGRRMRAPTVGIPPASCTRPILDDDDE